MSRKKYKDEIGVLDIFAGPGGLSEGFASAKRRSQIKKYSICLSIEKDSIAHRTLKLRSFYRQFDKRNLPQEYYLYLRGEIDRKVLFEKYSKEADKVSQEVWHAELGSTEFPHKVVDKRIKNALKGYRNWVLIGGPPCQAYSLVGRSRMKNSKSFKDDPRHYLYKEYLRILAKHSPAVFVMENVKGLLSSKGKNNEKIFDKIINDLGSPIEAVSNNKKGAQKYTLNYKIYSLAIDRSEIGSIKPSDFVVKSEKYGVPQARHRVILLGIRSDIKVMPDTLTESKSVTMWDVVSDLPRIRSECSGRNNEKATWQESLHEIGNVGWLNELFNDNELYGEISKLSQRVNGILNRGGEFINGKFKCNYKASWFYDSKLKGICNHTARTHMKSDLHRYFFSACYAKKKKESPKVADFPSKLLPDHKNIEEAINGKMFADRFRVQVRNKASSTVTSHIAKDGHYFIHPDPEQCRSLTVREAARLQTFPDNYFFEGPRTEQYKQVGNAVPPLLAKQIANLVYKIFNQ